MEQKEFNLIKQDPWLEPNAKDIENRYLRFKDKLFEIEGSFNSINEFSLGYKYFGINYDSKKKGWWYREWAPEAYALFLIGDFNNWDESSNPLIKNKFGVWEIFLDEKSYKTTFTNKSKIKVIVESAKGKNYRIPAYIKRVVQDEDTKNFSGQLWFSEEYKWTDKKFKKKKTEELFIYETHIGMAQDKEGVGSYKEFA